MTFFGNCFGYFFQTLGECFSILLVTLDLPLDIALGWGKITLLLSAHFRLLFIAIKQKNSGN
jgi:hypothetical protein